MTKPDPSAQHPGLSTQRSLVRWQHVAGDYWPYVCATPFLVEQSFPGAPRVGVTSLLTSPRYLTPPLTPPAGENRRGERNWGDPGRPRRSITRLPRALAVAISAAPRDECSAVLVDLPPLTTLRAAPELNRLGFIVVPVIQRWIATPAVLPGAGLVDQLIISGERCFRPRDPWGVIFLLDGDRAGPPDLANPERRAFDNRYAYPVCRFPPPCFLRAHGVASVYWFCQSELASDLEPYLKTIVDAGIPVARLDPAVKGRTAERAGTAVGRTSGIPTREVLSPRRGEARRGVTPGHVLKATLAEAPAPGLYRRFVRRAQTEGLLADHLFRGEPYLALNGLVLTRDEDALLRRLTETFASAFDRAGRALASNVPLLEGMGFPWVAAELLGAETPRTPLVGRFDFVRDEDRHWWLLEYNADTPSGIREAIAVESALCALLPEARLRSRPNAGLRDTLVAAFAEAVRGLPPGAALGLVTSAGELEDLAQMAYTRDILAEPLAAVGVPVVLGDVDNLLPTRSGLTLRGQRLGALYRYVPFETTFGTPAFAAIYDAVTSGKLRLLNGLYGLLLQHKGLLAWLWEHRDDSCFSPAEQAAIREHLPETKRIGDWVSGVGCQVSGTAGDALTLTLSQRERGLGGLSRGERGLSPSPSADGEGRGGEARSVVVKQVFGREGEEVYFGEDLSPADWALFRQRRTYVVQRRIAIDPLQAVIPTSLGPRAEVGHATVGSYAVAGRWGGYYTRFGAKIITARAKWLATLVES